MELSLFGGRYNIDKEEVRVSGKSQPEVLLGVRRYKLSTRIVRSWIIDVQCDSATRTGFRSIKPEETIARERYEGVGDICGRKDSVTQMMSSLSAVAWIERSVTLEQTYRLVEVHTFQEKGGAAADGV